MPLVVMLAASFVLPPELVVTVLEATVEPIVVIPVELMVRAFKAPLTPLPIAPASVTLPEPFEIMSEVALMADPKEKLPPQAPHGDEVIPFLVVLA